MHKTTAGEKRKILKAEAVELARDARAAMKAAKTLPEARGKARTLEDRAASLQAEAEALKGAARLDDLHIWKLEKVKTAKKGKMKFGYWMASWREGDRVRNVHLGSCAKVDREAAMQKAEKMKAEALGLY